MLAATRLLLGPLEPMGSSVVKPQATHAISESVCGLPLDQSATTTSAAQLKPEVFTLATRQTLEVLTPTNASRALK